MIKCNSKYLKNQFSGPIKKWKLLRKNDRTEDSTPIEVMYKGSMVSSPKKIAKAYVD